MTRTDLALATLVATAAAASIGAAPAQAGEVYGGAYVHAVDTPFTFDTGEGGVDAQLGYRFDPVTDKLGGPQPYIFGSVNSDGGTDFAGVGLSWKAELGPVYLRPGVGVVVHDAPGFRVDPETNLRTDLGSRVLFEPEIAIGTQVSERFSIEASWVHISNARLFNSRQNPGIDAIGIRLNYRL